MEEAKPIKGRKKLQSSDQFHVGVNVPKKKLTARKKIDKLIKKKAPLPRVRSQSVSPTSAASTSRIKELKSISKAGNKTDYQVARSKRNSLLRVRSQSVSPSVAGISRIRLPRKLPKTGNKTDKDAISKEKTAKSKDTGLVKPIKNTGIAKKTKDGGIAKTAKDTGTTKKTRDTGTAKKAEEDARNLNDTFEVSKEEVSREKSVVVNKIQKSEIAVKKPRVIEDVYEAIVTNGQPKKGVTSQAIKNYIFSKRGVEGEDKNGVKRLNTLVNNALKKGMEDGTLQRPTTSKGNGPIVSALGRFTLSNKVVKPKLAKKFKAKKGEGSETAEMKT